MYSGTEGIWLGRCLSQSNAPEVVQSQFEFLNFCLPCMDVQDSREKQKDSTESIVVASLRRTKNILHPVSKRRPLPISKFPGENQLEEAASPKGLIGKSEASLGIQLVPEEVPVSNEQNTLPITPSPARLVPSNKEITALEKHGFAMADSSEFASPHRDSAESFTAIATQFNRTGQSETAPAGRSQ